MSSPADFCIHPQYAWDGVDTKRETRPDAGVLARPLTRLNAVLLTVIPSVIAQFRNFVAVQFVSSTSRNLLLKTSWASAAQIRVDIYYGCAGYCGVPPPRTSSMIGAIADRADSMDWRRREYDFLSIRTVRVD